MRLGAGRRLLVLARLVGLLACHQKPAGSATACHALGRSVCGPIYKSAGLEARGFPFSPLAPSSYDGRGISIGLG